MTEEVADDTEPSRAPRRGFIGALLWPMRMLKRLYAWVVGWADTKYGTPALCAIGFAESSFFPIPPDPLLVALCLGKRKRSLYYGAMLTLFSVLGGIAGWFIGQAIFGIVADVISTLGADTSWFGTAESVADMQASEIAALPSAGGVVFYPDGYFYAVYQKFHDNALLAYFSAALSPIPYKVFTIAGGVFNVSLPMLIAGSLMGRGLRFMAISVLIFAFGDKVKPLLERYFEWITVAIVVLIVIFFVILRYLL